MSDCSIQSGAANLGPGTAWGGRRTCNADMQMGSNPIGSTNWGTELQGVITSFAMKKAEGFDPLVLHQRGSLCIIVNVAMKRSVSAVKAYLAFLTRGITIQKASIGNDAIMAKITLTISGPHDVAFVAVPILHLYIASTTTICGGTHINGLRTIFLFTWTKTWRIIYLEKEKEENKMTVRDVVKATDIYTSVLILRRKNLTQSIIDGDFGTARIIANDDAGDMLHGAVSDDVLDSEVAVISVEILRSRPRLAICIEGEQD